MTARDDDEYNADVNDEELAQANARRERIPLVRDALKLIEPVAEARSHCGHEVEMASANIGFELYQLYCGARRPAVHRLP
jgi:hypothetical protein